MHCCVNSGEAVLVRMFVRVDPQCWVVSRCRYGLSRSVGVLWSRFAGGPGPRDDCKHGPNPVKSLYAPRGLGVKAASTVLPTLASELLSCGRAARSICHCRPALVSLRRCLSGTRPALRSRFLMTTVEGVSRQRAKGLRCRLLRQSRVRGSCSRHTQLPSRIVNTMSADAS